MGGLFGVASREEGGCVDDLFYGTDYHSHLGTMRGGLAVRNHNGNYVRFIHNITNAQFRSKFEDDIRKMRGDIGIGAISDTDSQPIIVGSGLGDYALATVGRVCNLDEIIRVAYQRGAHFLNTENESRDEVNQSEIAAHLINSVINAGGRFEEGIHTAQNAIKGSCSLLLLSHDGIYAARDKLGRTPLVIGKKDKAYAVTFETTAFPNRGFKVERALGPGEIVFITPEGAERKMPPEERMQICSFLWVYYGYPSSHYEGVNVEIARKRCGAALARADEKDRKSGRLCVDCISGIPDSGTSHAYGYSNESGIPLQRPLVKYTPTWPRSFMPQDQKTRDLVAEMKLVPVPELIRGQRLLFCEDSIVRGTQLQDKIKILFEYGAKEVHMRPACPPLVYGCKFLNFSRSKSEQELATRKAIREITGKTEISPEQIAVYSNPNSAEYCEMVERIRIKLGLNSLRYQRLDDLVNAIGLPKEKLCTFCWDGCE